MLITAVALRDARESLPLRLTVRSVSSAELCEWMFVSAWPILTTVSMSSLKVMNRSWLPALNGFA